jgi:hypothetical protein
MTNLSAIKLAFQSNTQAQNLGNQLSLSIPSSSITEMLFLNQLVCQRPLQPLPRMLLHRNIH